MRHRSRCFSRIKADCDDACQGVADLDLDLPSRNWSPDRRSTWTYRDLPSLALRGFEDSRRISLNEFRYGQVPIAANGAAWSKTPIFCSMKRQVMQRVEDRFPAVVGHMAVPGDVGRPACS